MTDAASPCTNPGHVETVYYLARCRHGYLRQPEKVPNQTQDWHVTHMSAIDDERALVLWVSTIWHGGAR